MRVLVVAAAALFSALMSGCALPPPQVVRHEGGETVALEQLRGQVVVLNYWATWCPPCMHEIPSLVRIADEMQGRVVFLAVNDRIELYGRPAVARWLAKNPAAFTPYIVYANGGLLEKYPRRVFPTTYFLDVDGQLVDKVEGLISEQAARELVQKALDHSPHSANQP